MVDSHPLPADGELSLAAEGRAVVRRLFMEHYGATVRLAELLVGNRAVGEDLAQEAFALLLRRVDRLDRERDLAGYLHTVVVNLTRSARRRRLVVNRHAGRWAPPAPAPDDADRVVERTSLLGALAKLSGRQRECLVLRYYLDLPEADVAAVLGLSPGSVKTHTARGLASLARILGDEP